MLLIYRARYAAKGQTLIALDFFLIDPSHTYVASFDSFT